MRRKNSSVKAEIQNISNHGIWILINEEEFFMPYDDFPWFLKATVPEIYNFQFLDGHHLHWPDLDVDIDIDALKQASRGVSIKMFLNYDI